MPQVMATYEIIGHEVTANSFEIAIVDDVSVLAKTTVARPAIQIDFQPLDKMRDDLEAEWSLTDHEVLDLHGLINSQIQNFTVFRGIDVHAALLDAGYRYLMRHQVGRYQRATIDIEDDKLVISADGFAAAPSTPPGAASPRPRRRKGQIHSWI